MKIYHNPRTLFSLAVCVVAFSDWMLTAFLSQGLGMVVLYPWSYGPSSFPGFLYGRVIWTHDSVFELDIPWSYSPSSFPDSLYMYSGTVSLIPWSQFFPWPVWWNYLVPWFCSFSGSLYGGSVFPDPTVTVLSLTLSLIRWFQSLPLAMHVVVFPDPFLHILLNLVV